MSPSASVALERVRAKAVPLTFMVNAYNEQDRIEAVLAHAVQWADEVIVVDKSSTDRTAEIASGYHPKVRVLPVPFSPQGRDNTSEWVQAATYDWIFCGTCSEIPTRRLIEEARKILEKEADRLELIWVPRRMYSFGIHDPNSPWNVAYYPFLIHREKVLITEVIHEHIKPRNSANTRMIAYTEDCCVYHLTHPSVARFLEIHAEYARVEAETDEDPARAIVDCFNSISECAPRIFQTGSNWPALFSAWCLYNYMKILFIWEKERGLNVKAYYQQLREDLLQQAWGIGPQKTRAEQEPSSTSGTLLLNEKKSQRKLKQIVFLSYMVANAIYHLQNPNAIPGSLRTWLAERKRRLIRWFKR